MQSRLAGNPFAMGHGPGQDPKIEDEDDEDGLPDLEDSANNTATNGSNLLASDPFKLLLTTKERGGLVFSGKFEDASDWDFALDDVLEQRLSAVQHAIISGQVSRTFAPSAGLSSADYDRLDRQWRAQGSLRRHAQQPERLDFGKAGARVRTMYCVPNWEEPNWESHRKVPIGKNRIGKHI